MSFTLLFVTIAAALIFSSFDYRTSVSADFAGCTSNFQAPSNRTPAEILKLIAAVDVTELNSTSLRRYICAGLCTYRCVTRKQEDEDVECWFKCGTDLSENVTLERFEASNYTASYYGSPYLVQLRWDPVPNAIGYLVVWRGRTDNYNLNWNSSGVVLNAPQFSFRKPCLCSYFKFTVGAVVSPNKIIWSQGTNITRPAPTIAISPMGEFTTVSDMRNLSAEQILVHVKYEIPQGWSSSTDVETVYLTRNSSCYPVGEQHKELKLPADDTLSLLFPKHFLADQCVVNVSIKNLTSKCNSTANYPDNSLLIDFSCKNPSNSLCEQNKVFTASTSDQCPVSYDCKVRHMSPRVLSQSSGQVVDQDLSNCSDGSVHLFVKWRAPPRTSDLESCDVKYYAIKSGSQSDFLQHENGASATKKIQRISADQPLHGKKYQTAVTFDTVGPKYYFSICAIYDSQLQLFQLKWPDSPNKSTRFVYDSNFYCTDSEEEEEEQKWISASEEFNLKTKSASSEERDQLETRKRNIMISAILLPVIVTIAALIGWSIAWMRKRRRHKTMKRFSIDTTSDETKNENAINYCAEDRFELPRNRLVVFDYEQALGSGAFGTVYKGVVVGRSDARRKSSIGASSYENSYSAHTLVAVKQCFVYADPQAKSQFRQEIQLMQGLGFHVHIVNMLYKVTETEPLSLIVEYCENGDLRHFLRNIRMYILELAEKGIDISDGVVSSQTNIDEDKIVTQKDIFMFAFEVSDGLEYLHSRNFIHRDLAARNILVDKSRRCKIGDFGLCRFVTQSPVYLGRGGKIPIKWMSLEALKEYRFTKQNDIWSFGVLLFEILTLGGTPYPDVMPGDGNFQAAMISYLESGRRMDTPDNCQPDVYDLMLRTWSCDQAERPTASELREELRVMISRLAEEEADEMYKLDPNKDYYRVTDPYSDEERNSTSKQSTSSSSGGPQGRPWSKRSSGSSTTPITPSNDAQTPGEKLHYIEPVRIPKSLRSVSKDSGCSLSPAISPRSPAVSPLSPAAQVDDSKRSKYSYSNEAILQLPLYPTRKRGVSTGTCEQLSSESP